MHALPDVVGMKMSAAADILSEADISYTTEKIKPHGGGDRRRREAEARRAAEKKAAGNEAAEAVGAVGEKAAESGEKETSGAVEEKVAENAAFDEPEYQTRVLRQRLSSDGNLILTVCDVPEVSLQ